MYLDRLDDTMTDKLQEGEFAVWHLVACKPNCAQTINLSNLYYDF